MICACIVASFDVHKKSKYIIIVVHIFVIFHEGFVSMFSHEKIFFHQTYLFTDLDVVILEEGMVLASHWGQRTGVDLGSNKS